MNIDAQDWLNRPQELPEEDEELEIKKFYSDKFGARLVHISPGMKVPEGARVVTGARGGKYYVSPERSKNDEEIESTPTQEEGPSGPPVDTWERPRLIEEFNSVDYKPIKFPKIDEEMQKEYEYLREYFATHEDDGSDDFFLGAKGYAQDAVHPHGYAEEGLKKDEEASALARKNHPDIPLAVERGLRLKDARLDFYVEQTFSYSAPLFSNTPKTKKDFILSRLHEKEKKIQIDVDENVVRDLWTGEEIKFKDAHDLMEILHVSYGMRLHDEKLITLSLNFFRSIGVDRGDPIEKWDQKELAYFYDIIERQGVETYHPLIKSQEELYRFCQYIGAHGMYSAFRSLPSYLDEKHADKLIDWVVGQTKKKQSLGHARPPEGNLLELLIRNGASFKVRVKAYNESIKLHESTNGVSNPVSPPIESDDFTFARHRFIQGFLLQGGTDENQDMCQAVHKIFNNGTNRLLFYWRDNVAKTFSPVTNRIPESNPQSEALVKDIYRETQEYFKKKNVQKITLYRGVRSHVTTSAPLESWTTDASCARKFDREGGEVLKVTVPIDRIFMSYKSQRVDWWPESQLKGKKEYTLLGLKNGKSLFDEFKVEKI